MTAEYEHKRLAALEDVLLAIKGILSADRRVVADTIWADEHNTVVDRLVAAAYQLGATQDQLREVLL